MDNWTLSLPFLLVYAHFSFFCWGPSLISIIIHTHVCTHSICSFKIAQVGALSIKRLPSSHPFPPLLTTTPSHRQTNAAHVFQYKQFVVSVSIDAPRIRKYVCMRLACMRACGCVCVCARHIIKSTNTKTSTQTVKAMIDSVDIRFLASKRQAASSGVFVHWILLMGRLSIPYRNLSAPLPSPQLVSPAFQVWANDELHCMCLYRGWVKFVFIANLLTKFKGEFPFKVNNLMRKCSRKRLVNVFSSICLRSRWNMQCHDTFYPTIFYKKIVKA